MQGLIFKENANRDDARKERWQQGEKDVVYNK